jgi:Restriction endonuclease PvuII.
MSFYDQKHKTEIQKIEILWDNLTELNKLAKSYGISDIFQDNGAKVLQQLIYLNMKILPGREGNDCISESGMEWEMKSINLETSASGFSTNHHTTHDIITKYRQVPWTFAIYFGIKLAEMYVMTPQMLEPLYQKWEEKLLTTSHLNNPKIPVKYVRLHGIQVFPINQNTPINPDNINI